MNQSIWKSILAAVITGAASGTAQYTSAGGTNLKGTGIVAGVGALFGLASYLAKSPLQTSPPPPVSQLQPPLNPQVPQ